MHGEEEIELSLFAHDMIVSEECPKESAEKKKKTQKLLEPISSYSKVIRYEINT